MSDPVFGVTVKRTRVEPRGPIRLDFSKLGVIGPASGADPEAFPLDVPVNFYSNDTVMIGKLGADDYLQDFIRGVNDQLVEFQLAADLTVVRTAKGVNADAALAAQATIANILGSSTSATGLWAFTRAPMLLKKTPRLIGVPGYTGQMSGAVGTPTIGTAGSGYVAETPPVVTFSGGGSSPSKVLPTGVAVVSNGGAVTGITVTNPGAWLSGAVTVAIAAPTTGVQALATVGVVNGANPICAGLDGVLNSLMAHAVVESSGASKSNDAAWRATLNSGRLIPVSGGVKVIDATGATVTMPLVGRILGLGAAVDHQTGGPFRSWANRAIKGIVGPGREMSASFTNGDNEAQELLALGIGVLVRGEPGNDSAIADGGFVFVGTDVALDEGDDWQFYHASRIRDWMDVQAVRILRGYLGKYNLTAQAVQATVNSLNFLIRDLKADDALLGGRASFQGSQNSVEEIRQGHLVVGFAAEEPAVLRKVTVMSSRYREAVVSVIQSLETSLAIAA